MHDEINNAAWPQLKKGTYRHYKGGLYEVLGTARHTETSEPLVIYRQLNSDDDGHYWARPYDMFCEVVNWQDRTVPRFELVED